MEPESGENSNEYYPFFPVFITSLILIGIGLVGLGALFIFTVPTLGPRW
jgi:hypothetical protein